MRRVGGGGAQTRGLGANPGKGRESEEHPTDIEAPEFNIVEEPTVYLLWPSEHRQLEQKKSLRCIFSLTYTSYIHKSIKRN